MNFRKFIAILVIALFSYGAYSQYVHKVDSPVDFVNPLMGSQSKFLLSHGNVYPAIALPWGMNFWTPQTGEMGSGWQYSYTDERIRGFKQTHMPSPWM
ncbi:MAG: glycoside hydrolase family 92 protein, partial [Cyclobacteriaceae bacterium]